MVEPVGSRPAPGADARLRPPTPRVALLIGAAVLVVFLLYQGRDALTPFIVGLLLVYLLNPAVEWLSKRRVPRWAAVLAVYVVTIVAIFEVLSLTLRPLVDQVSQFARDLPALAGSLDQQLQRVGEFYRGLQLPPQIRAAVDSWLTGLGESGAGFDPGVLLPVVNLTAGLVSAIFGYLIIPVWAFYLLKDRPGLARSLDQAIPPEWREDVWAILHAIRRVFGQWVRGQAFLGITVGVATFAGLMILSAVVDPVFGRFALLLSIIAGLFELLPIIGPILAAVPAVLLAATAGLEAMVAAVILYTVVQQLENNLLVPKIQGDAVEMHPSAVMFALVVGGAIAGLLGAILALPVTAAGRDVFRYLFRRLSPPAPRPPSGESSATIEGADPAEPAQPEPAEPAPDTAHA